MQSGRITPLTPSEAKEAIKNAPFKFGHYAEWRDTDNKLHRTGDLPATVFDDGTQVWMLHDKLHRDNGLRP